MRVELRNLLGRLAPFLAWGWVVGVLLVLPGCKSGSGPQLSESLAGNPHPSPARTAETVQMFEKRRDDALFAAAAARWEEGDFHGCQMLLSRLLNRNPEYRPGLLMLSDLQVAQGDVAAAEHLFRQWLDRHPQDAEAHHSLGLLLETVDRPREAIVHLQRATELAPQAPLYRESHTMLASVLRPAPAGPRGPASGESVRAAHAPNPPPGRPARPVGR